MSVDKVITMCHWRRRDYTRMCLNHLARCRGIRDYTVLMHLDGDGSTKVYAACTQFRGSKEVKIRRKTRHLCCNGNTFEALTDGFSHCKYVLHVEDDILLAPDALEYFEWARRFESDKRIFTIGAWRHPNGWLPNCSTPCNPHHNYWAGLSNGFYVWGWATWASRWNEIKAGWTKGNDQSMSWDNVVEGQIRRGRYSITPYISRANNIGDQLGTHRGAEILSYWAGSHGFAKTKPFRLV